MHLYGRWQVADGTARWREQKFQKPQNENFCLTNLNVENNGNFPILSFGVCNTMEQIRDFQIRKKKGEGDVLLPK